MSTHRKTDDYTSAYARLERIAARLKSGPVAPDELARLLAKSEEAYGVCRDRIAAVSRLVRRTKPTGPQPPHDRDVR